MLLLFIFRLFVFRPYIDRLVEEDNKKNLTKKKPANRSIVLSYVHTLCLYHVEHFKCSVWFFVRLNILDEMVNILLL